MVQLPQTARLRFRQVRADDAELFDALDRDEDVMQFIDWEPPTLEEQREAVAGYIAEYERWPNHGRFVAESRAGEFLGWFGLRVHTDPFVPDLGYRLHRRLWGRGLATEGSLALIDYAFVHLGARAVQADSMFDNQASRRVMEKCGMTYVKTFQVHFDNPLPGTEHGEVLYQITRDEWLTRCPSPPCRPTTTLPRHPRSQPD
jgi:RimJ/RimL family protein N-acetyltransferase